MPKWLLWGLVLVALYLAWTKLGLAAKLKG